MFHELVSGAAWPGERPALISPGKVVSWRDLREHASARPLVRFGLAGRRVGLVFRATATSICAVAELDSLASDVFLMASHLSSSEALALGRELRLGVVLTEDDADSWRPTAIDDALPGSGRSSVTVLTSGTSGRPKAIRHTWESLSRPTRRSLGTEAPRWLMTYRPHLYAGLQVLLQCLLDGGTLVVPEEGAAPASVAELMRSSQVEYASATPSYWRRLLLFSNSDVLREVPLKQITLGGEVVDQQILDALKHAFPGVRLTHIYATTELGRCFSVTDGKAGFPTRYLHEPNPEGVELRMENGELVIRSANSMVSSDQGAADRTTEEWGHRTGDLVEVVGDRAYFAGRRSDLINVGGDKVRPIEVERVVRAVPGVADARVYGKKSSIAGELVCCQVVPASAATADTLREAIAAACLSQLTPVQRPRLIDIVSEIDLDSSGKTSRKMTT